MKKVLAFLLAAGMVFTLTACAASGTPPSRKDADDAPPSAEQETSTEVSDKPVDPAADTSTDRISIVLTVGNNSFSATLLNNETTSAFVELLPLTLDMNELNGNEKFFYLDNSLSTDSYQPGQINAGDLMLYGNNCLVLFYESFSSGYSYTRLGSLDDSTGLAEALGAGNVKVTFSMGGE